MAESLFATIKTELLHRQAWPTRTAARQGIFEYVEGWSPTDRAGLATFQVARSSGDFQTVGNADTQLKTAVARRVPLSEAKAIGDRLDGVVHRQ